MSREAFFALAADGILLLHVLFVAFVVAGLALVYIGLLRGWRWVGNWWFRAIHLVAIGVVVAQSWLGQICPLTSWEMALRQAAGDASYGGSFIQYWLQSLLYYNAPQWVFIVAYSLFGTLVLASWFVVPPRHRGH